MDAFGIILLLGMTDSIAASRESTVAAEESNGSTSRNGEGRPLGFQRDSGRLG